MRSNGNFLTVVVVVVVAAAASVADAAGEVS